MSKARLKVTVTPDANVGVVAIHIDGKVVPLINDVGTCTVESPGRYVLMWHFSGPEGAAIGILVEQAGATVVQIKQTKVPKGENAGAGVARLEV